MTRLFLASWCVLLSLFAVGCDDWNGAKALARKQAEEWRIEREGPCVEYATLVATTTGSPDSARCPNVRHRIDVQPATLAGEEIGALVTCRCVAATDGGGR